MILEGVSHFEYRRGKTGCVLIHGFTATPWGLRELGEYLADKEISVEAPLLPGHGTKPDDMIGVSWQEWVDAAREAVAILRNRCDEIFLVGHSMGGAIALFLASRMDVNGVVSLSAPVALSGIKTRLIPFIRPFKRYWGKRRRRPHDYSEIREYDCYPLDAVLELKKFLAVVLGSLHEVRCPVLAAHARGDRRVSEKSADLIYGRVASEDKRKIVLEDPCHLVTMGKDKERLHGEIFEFVHAHSKHVG